MKRKEYIQKVTQAVLNRIRFHSPIVYDSNIDKRLLFDFGINPKLPIFKFDKMMNKHLLKAFMLAGRQEQFNLLISTEGLGQIKDRQLAKLNNVVLYSKDTIPKSVMEMINKLNINYPSSSNYNLVYKDKFFKVQDEILNPHFDEFCLKQVCVVDGIFVQYSEFMLNGNNYFVKFQNKGDKEKKVNLELNIPLQKGYYFFKRQTKNILVENLMTKEKFYFNFICRNAKFSFSDVDGLENSVFCCINAKVTVNLQQKEEGFVFFNMSQECFSFKGEADIKKFMEISRVKCCEIFNVQVKSKNPKFDLFFNKTLPQKIWVNWINGEFDEALEQKYISLKRLFVKGEDKLSLVCFREIGLRELGIFNGEYYKKILIIQSGEKFLRVGRTFFYNINGITMTSLKSKEPIAVCFGE